MIRLAIFLGLVLGAFGSARAQTIAQGLPVTNQVLQARLLTKSDSTQVLQTRAIFVGDAAACDAAFVFNGDSAAVTFSNLEPGVVYPFSIRMLMSTNTTCTKIIGLY